MDPAGCTPQRGCRLQVNSDLTRTPLIGPSSPWSASSSPTQPESPVTPRTGAPADAVILSPDDHAARLHRTLWSRDARDEPNKTYSSPPRLDVSSSTRTPKIFSGTLTLGRDPEVLGSGAFCSTLLSKDSSAPTPTTYAVKVPMNKPSSMPVVAHEALVLSQLFAEHDRLEGLVQFLGLAWTDAGEPAIVMPVYPHTLQQFVLGCHESDVNSPLVGKHLFKRWARQLTSALGSLEAHDIVHCDIKPDNVLLDDHLNAYLCDFSSAVTTMELQERHPASNLSSMAASIEFAAPELLSSSSMPSPATDLYSLGLVLLYCATGAEPYSAPVKHFTQRLMWARKGAALQVCSAEQARRLPHVLPLLKSILEDRAGLAQVQILIDGLPESASSPEST